MLWYIYDYETCLPDRVAKQPPSLEINIWSCSVRSSKPGRLIRPPWSCLIYKTMHLYMIWYDMIWYVFDVQYAYIYIYCIFIWISLHSWLFMSIHIYIVCIYILSMQAWQCDARPLGLAASPRFASASTGGCLHWDFRSWPGMIPSFWPVLLVKKHQKNTKQRPFRSIAAIEKCGFDVFQKFGQRENISHFVSVTCWKIPPSFDVPSELNLHLVLGSFLFEWRVYERIWYILGLNQTLPVASRSMKHWHRCMLPKPQVLCKWRAERFYRLFAAQRNTMARPWWCLGCGRCACCVLGSAFLEIDMIHS